MATKKSSTAVKPDIIRNVTAPPADVWRSLLRDHKLTIAQCRNGAAWAFGQMPPARRARAMFALIEITYRLEPNARKAVTHEG